MSTSVKLSLKNVWKKRFRFLVMTIICALSLAFLSFTLELSDDKLRQNVYTSIDAGYTYTTIQKATKLPKDYVKTSFYDDYIGNSLPINSYQAIKEANPNLTVHQYQNVNINLVGKDSERANNFYSGSVEYLVKFDMRYSNHGSLTNKINLETCDMADLRMNIERVFNELKERLESMLPWNMMKKYESPEIDIHLINYDILTTSDNDTPFDSEDDETQDWGQYY